MVFRVLFAIAVHLDLDITQMDVKTAFLYRLIDKLIYIRLLTSYKQEEKICRLLKVLYSLKQSLRLWYKTLEDHLRKSLSLKYLNADHSIFISDRDFNGPIVAVFVDDIKILSSKGTDYGAIV